MILLFLLSTISLQSTACADGDNYIATVEKNGDSIYFADHSESAEEGNWIFLEGGKAIRLPEPFSFTYNGVNKVESSGASLELNVENYTDYSLTYPYATHSFYTINENVVMDFNGSSAFKDQEVKIYLVDMESMGLSSIYDVFKLIKGENQESFKDIFNDTVDSYAQVETLALDENGDMSSSLDLGTQPAGIHGLFILLNDTSGENKIISMTCFEVLEYDLGIKASETLEEGNNLDINLGLEGADDGTFTYGAVLIKESAYYAEMELNSDGTRAGTDVIMNGIDIIEEFEINSSNYKSKLGKDELQTEIQTLIGEGNGTITVGEENQYNLSLTTFDLSADDYLLFAGVYEKGKGLVGIDQKELTIETAGVSDQSSTSSLSSDSSPSNSNKLKIISKNDDGAVEGKVTMTAPSSQKEEYEVSYSEAKGIANDVPKEGIPKEIMGFVVGFAAILFVGMTTLKKLK